MLALLRPRFARTGVFILMLTLCAFALPVLGEAIVMRELRYLSHSGSFQMRRQTQLRTNLRTTLVFPRQPVFVCILS
eukprot:4937985-Amphidinium_carterae.3